MLFAYEPLAYTRTLEGISDAAMVASRIRFSVRSRSCSSVGDAGPEAIASHASQSRAI